MSNLRSTKLVATALMAAALTVSMAGGALAREHSLGTQGNGGGLGQIIEHHHGGIPTVGTLGSQPGSDWSYPVPATMPTLAQYPNVAACEAHFRTYNPATGEFIGLDHKAHYCSLGVAG